MHNWTITNKIVAIARAAQQGTTPRHSWTISTFTRFPLFSRFATRKRKRSLRRLSNQRLRETFMEPSALFLRIFSCSFCVLCSFFRHLTLLFGEFFIPASIRSTRDANEVDKLWHLSLILSTVHKTYLVAKEAPLLTQRRQYVHRNASIPIGIKRVLSSVVRFPSRIKVTFSTENMNGLS